MNITTNIKHAAWVVLALAVGAWLFYLLGADAVPFILGGVVGLGWFYSYSLHRYDVLAARRAAHTININITT